MAGSDATRRILAWTLRRLFHEVGLLSWNRLMRLMQQAGLRWARPGGLMPTAGPEEIARGIERNREEDRELFLRKPPEITPS